MSMSSEISQTTSVNVSGNLQAYLTFSHNTNSWIIDSGATDHMTNNPSIVHAFIPINHKHEVSIANGATILVSVNGKIKIFPQSSTSKVLVVPLFPVQLLSVGKITNSLNCDVIFSLSSVIFQDRKTKKMIGEGIYSDGLYLLNTADKACHTKMKKVISYTNDLDTLQLAFYQAFFFLFLLPLVLVMFANFQNKLVYLLINLYLCLLSHLS